MPALPHDAELAATYLDTGYFVVWKRSRDILAGPCSSSLGEPLACRHPPQTLQVHTHKPHGRKRAKSTHFRRFAVTDQSITKWSRDAPDPSATPS